jgi:putative tryptophan/tyrosine transport system substrate-binding protein
MIGSMRRRDLIAMLGVLPIVLPIAGRAQPTDRIRRIGYLTGASGSPEDELGVRETRALVEGLRELGWFDGRNIAIEHRFSGIGRARIGAIAKELVAINPDVIVTVGGATTAAVAAETGTIPVVFTVVGDPVGSGIVANLARPGGNVTGFSSQEAPLGDKWLQLLKEIAPSITRVLVIMQTDLAQNRVMRDAVAAASPSMGITVATAEVHDLSEVTPAVEAFARTTGGGLVVLTNPIMGSDPRVYFAAAAQNHLPAIYSYPIFARTGGLVSYGTDPVEQFRGAAGYVDKILRGAKPGVLPVQLPTKFYLAVNLKTAKALGLTVPPTILARADEVIE